MGGQCMRWRIYFPHCAGEDKCLFPFVSLWTRVHSVLKQPGLHCRVSIEGMEEKKKDKYYWRNARSDQTVWNKIRGQPPASSESYQWIINHTKVGWELCLNLRKNSTCTQGGNLDGWKQIVLQTPCSGAKTINKNAARVFSGVCLTLWEAHTPQECLLRASPTPHPFV